MGVYYKAICDERRESLNPGYLNDLGVKLDAITHPEHPFGPLLICVLAYLWPSCRLINDYIDEETYYGYTDITEWAVRIYRKQNPSATIRYTGPGSHEA